MTEFCSGSQLQEYQSLKNCQKEYYLRMIARAETAAKEIVQKL
jgi:hypothetical protein